MKAVQVSSKGAPLEVVTLPEKPVMEGENDVIIKVEYSACNPVDNFMAATGMLVESFPFVVGCDCSGTVEAVGQNSKFKVGDRVATYPGLGKPTTGTFAEYVKADSRLVFQIPESMQLEEASTLGVGSLTACMLFYGVFGKEVKEGADKHGVLVYGASSSVGMYAVQFAHLEGHSVVAVASQKNHELLKSLGADVCLDYKTEGWTAKAVEALKERGVPIAIDTIANDGTLKACAQIVQACGGKTIATTLPHDSVGSVNVEAVNLGVLPGEAEGTAKLYEYVAKCNTLLKDGKLKGNPTKLVPGGLGAVAQALADLSNGKASGSKFVVNVQN